MAKLIFEYLYRDAANYKSYGWVQISGHLPVGDQAQLIECADAAEFFIAEQVGLPMLYDGLYGFNGGPNLDDHAWHSIGKFTTLPDHILLAQDTTIRTGPELLDAFVLAKGGWDPTLSRHFRQQRDAGA